MSIEVQTESDESLTNKTAKASGWILFGHFWNQSIRFIGNLVLTRLLIPEDFGLMQLVLVFLIGVNMLSDLGLSVNIIQHKKGEDPSFLRTAWTVQIMRGFIIEGILILLALPLSLVYQAPPLIWLIPLAGLNAIIDGLASMNLAVTNRKMQMAKITLLEGISQFIGMVVMLVFAWYFRSVWTLLISGFVSGTIKTIYSHILFPSPSMAITWIKEDVREIIDFGKWIFVGSIAGFLISRVDRVILGLYLSTTELGLYGIAIAIPMALFELLQTYSQKILIPLYSHLWNNSLKTLRQKTLHIRTLLMIFSLLPLFALIIWGQNLINLLYPLNYQNAGWLLQILAVAYSIKSICATVNPILYATGDSFRAMVLVFIYAILLVICMLLGEHYFGLKGVIWSIPFTEFLCYPVLVATIKKYGVWQPWLDLSGFVATCAVVYFGVIL